MRQAHLPEHQALTLASRIKGTPNCEYIHELAGHPSEWVRLEIAKCAGAPEPVLRGLWLNDPVSIVRQAARATLDRQGRLSPGPISQLRQRLAAQEAA